MFHTWVGKETVVHHTNDISPLVQRVYRAIDSSEDYKKYITDIKIAEKRAGSFLMDIPGDSLDDTIHDLLSRNIPDDQAEASVRDGISSIEVLVMKKSRDGSVSLLDGTPVSPEPDRDESVRIAMQKMRLPSRFSRRWNIDSNIRAIEDKCRDDVKNWQKNFLLAGQLVLFLDDDLKCELAGCKLRYSYENGLMYEKESDENDG